MYNFLLSALILLLLQSCSEELDYRSNARSSDLVVDATTELRINFPDRSILTDENPNIKSLLNSYYIKLSPEGENCSSTEVFENVGTYEDNSSVTYPLAVLCDYQIEFLLGNVTETSNLNLASGVTYEQIQPIVQDNCVSCHAEYETYGGMFEDLDNIAFQIGNGFMPPSGTLSAFEVASFLAWKADGYLEEDPNPIPKDSPRLLMNSVYYRNNYNSYIYSYLLQTQIFLIYEDTLWLQTAGADIGLSAIELQISKPNSESQEP